MSRIIRFELIVTLPDHEDSATVQIGCDTTNPPLVAFMVATENMMNAMCLQSNQPYEEAMRLLVEGATKSKTLMSQGVRKQ